MMSMTSKERVITVFAHKEPDRVPAWCGASPEFWEKAKRELGVWDDEELLIRFGDDFRKVEAGYTGPVKPLSPEAVYRTPFGIDRKGYGYGQPISHPLANATLDDVHSYSWPDPEWTDECAWRGPAALTEWESMA